MKKWLISIPIGFAVLLYGMGCNYRNVEWIKERSPKRLTDSGFKLTGYEGYQIGMILQCPGGIVWYQIERDGVLYEVACTRWGEEVHIYQLRAASPTVDLKRQ